MLTHPQFDSAHPGCPQCRPIVKSVLEEWLSKTTRHDAVKLLLDLGFSAGPVQTPKEVYESEQLQARQLFIEIEDGLGGVIRTVGNPLKFSGLQPRQPCRAPFLGEHTTDVLTDVLGLTQDEIDGLGLELGAKKP
jgi:crotonobetainyl-CoA:carnitine CoA-transferase CaiB-like acyl-CoA transferase